MIMKKEHEARTIKVTVSLFLLVFFLFNENIENGMKSGKRKTGEKRKEKIIVVMASRRRAMKELSRVTFPLTPRPVVAHPGSPLGVSPREKERIY